MAHNNVLCHSPAQMNTLKRNRSSILRPNELVEIQGSYWPRVIFSESEEPLKKYYTKTGRNKKSPSSIIVSKRIKKKIELVRQLKKFSPVLSSISVQRPISPSFEASPNSLSNISAFHQKTSYCLKPPKKKISKIKTSSFTGRPVFLKQRIPRR
mmetsp:Transcript_10596/g.25515  ORF Transcript_10596/g.25515 Transcript_10596/m.25515 type:complete len:154 (+) Transcript_10596:184-645(+)|eukprot:CAMPEP_0197183398 /NCGR_PEP_ID=MMETSP1423-20130617/7796_1 /TAXON_ID=476441 /ORGANISM="Pseudo-nitzschia heimii, Strain UNC1101" /LENGTH=153 /DNA_ID=CAMNT_0042633977 /DNA_START=101 /DNA_END=562 /DNA_ORIENTATION=+